MRSYFHDIFRVLDSMAVFSSVTQTVYNVVGKISTQLKLHIIKLYTLQDILRTLSIYLHFMSISYLMVSTESISCSI